MTFILLYNRMNSLFSVAPIVQLSALPNTETGQTKIAKHKHAQVLIICNADLGGMIATIRATATSEEGCIGLVIGSAIRVEDTAIGFTIETLVAKEAYFIWDSTFNVGLVNVKHSCDK